MSAFFQQQPLIRPLPAREGFSVDATALINSGFAVGANFALGTGESRSSTSLSSPDSLVTSTSSIPLIKIYPVDEHCFRDCFSVEPRSETSSSFTMLAYQDFCCGYLEDGFENRFEAKTNQDLRLRGSNSGEQQVAGPLLGEADSLFSGLDGLIISHPSVLSLVLDDYSEVSDEPTQNTAEQDEGNTSISTLDSGGPRTPPRSSSPSLSELGYSLGTLFFCQFRRRGRIWILARTFDAYQRELSRRSRSYTNARPRSSGKFSEFIAATSPSQG